jgi:hypothetical protein
MEEMTSRTTPIVQVGITTDGRAVFDFFPACDTHGIPLSTVLEFVHDHQKEMIFGWQAFITQAGAAGWRLDRKLIEWTALLRDIFGPDYAAAWQARTNRFLSAHPACLPPGSPD